MLKKIINSDKENFKTFCMFLFYLLIFNIAEYVNLWGLIKEYLFSK
ncbi:MAG: hypothetical protein FD136_1735 [Chitinophagaceae bacterium]|nr:MAG: hypothetical protein FD136_1735 [Chitinophagaceae bacterium]